MGGGRQPPFFLSAKLRHGLGEDYSHSAHALGGGVKGKGEGGDLRALPVTSRWRLWRGYGTPSLPMCSHPVTPGLYIRGKGVLVKLERTSATWLLRAALIFHEAWLCESNAFLSVGGSGEVSGSTSGESFGGRFLGFGGISWEGDWRGLSRDVCMEVKVSWKWVYVLEICLWCICGDID